MQSGQKVEILHFARMTQIGHFGVTDHKMKWNFASEQPKDDPEEATISKKRESSANFATNAKVHFCADLADSITFLLIFTYLKQ